ncbi:uncharacterized protein BDV14DRAFT_179918 [Aspergillus stella-maris]|uniref:uncharacterized protein n=1 Tax=Aspergillus stella-maris TaxID=1810926 RepID=UPI003CCDB4F5
MPRPRCPLSMPSLFSERNRSEEVIKCSRIEYPPDLRSERASQRRRWGLRKLLEMLLETRKTESVIQRMIALVRGTR